MRFWPFVRDRWPYIAIYAAFSLLTVTIVQLDLWLSGSSLQWANLLYLLLLGFAGLTLYLAIDYRRQVAFYRRLTQIAASGSLDEMGVLAEPLTQEQQLFRSAWLALYARLRTALTEEHDRAQRRVHMLSQWAHHMKTPVSVIHLELQKARQQPPSPALEALISSVSEENERMRHALQMLLNVIRLDDFAADYHVERVDLLALVRQVVNEQRRAFIAHRVFPKVVDPEVGQSAGGAHWYVESDPKWLRLVLEQILSNAIKYASRAGGPDGEVDGPGPRAVAQPDGEGQVVFRMFSEGDETILEIADNGIGIAPEDLGRVFTPFFTGAHGRTHTASTGLGLYLAQAACQALGHRLTLHSVPGEGTRVRIHFKHERTLFSDLKNAVPRVDPPRDAPCT